MIRFVTLGLFLAGFAAAQARVPVVVELFTSEGCSSCPPVDEILARYDDQILSDRAGKNRVKQRARRESSNVEVIVLGEHVDYWDDAAWKDRFSSPLFSARQQDLGLAMRQATVYTPQVIVNGEFEVRAPDSRSLTRAIQDASAAPRAPVTLQHTPSGNIQVAVGKLPPGTRQADVLLAIAETGLETRVGGGENQGRILRHAAVVRNMSKLAELDSDHPGEYIAEAKLNLRQDWMRPNVKVVVFIQDRDNRKIVGAATIKAPPEAQAKARPEDQALSAR